ncbi:MAG: preprotein translocase subunit SecG [Myxococcota bacterium]|nr:preprotein translocase subunit SecG [Myxococcota bacterium]
MTPFLIALHVIVSIFLIAVVLLQRGKGAEMGAVFGGGGSSTVFGSRGAGNFLTRLTTGAAVVFMLTSLGLSYAFTTASSDRLFDAPVPGEEGAAPATDQPLFEEVGQAPAAEHTAGAPADGADGLPALPAPGDTEGTPDPSRQAAPNGLPTLPAAGGAAGPTGD